MITKRILFCISATVFFTHIIDAKTITPYFSIRSQGLNTPRHISGMIEQAFTAHNQNVHGTFAAVLEYSRSFDNEEITNCLFGTKECPAITISGSRVGNRGAQDWLADYFYLPTDFKSTISFKPVVDNVLLDFNFYLGLDEWAPGLYFTLYTPLVHSRWNIRMCETIDAKGTSTYVPGYFTPDTLARNELFNNFTQYADGTKIGPITQTVAGTDFTVIFQQLKNAKMSSSRLSRTRFADIRAGLGYNFIQNETAQVALQAFISAPSGTRPEGKYLFEPVIGNSHHWEFGAGFVGIGTLWKSEDEERQILLFGDISLMHLFSARQRRTFDLKNKPFSRYMLAQSLGTPISDNLQGNGTAPSAQFQHEFLPIANLTNVSIDSKISLQAEFTACLTVICNRVSWNVGYNFWGRTDEQIKLHVDNPFANNTKWALKGDAHVYGFDRGAGGSGALVGAVPLSATQSTATICGGKNFVATNTVAQAILNPNIDHPQNASGDSANATASYPLSAEPHATSITIKTSIDPVFLQTTDIDVCHNETSGMSSSLFTHFSYAWNDREGWVPYIGIGGQIEFAHHKNASCNDNCSGTNCTTSNFDTCIRCALSKWGAWCKGGITF